MNYNSDFRYDLEYGIVEGESWFILNMKVGVNHLE